MTSSEVASPKKDDGSDKGGGDDKCSADDEDDVGRHDDSCDDGSCGESGSLKILDEATRGSGLVDSWDDW